MKLTSKFVKFLVKFEVSIRTLLLINCIGIFFSILSKKFIKNQKVSFFISNLFLYAGTVYIFMGIMNRPKYEQEQVEIKNIEETAKIISSKSSSENESESTVFKIKNENLELQTSLNSSGMKINSINLLEFKTREGQDLKTIDENSCLQFSLYDGEKEMSFNDFSKTEDGFRSSNKDVNCSYSFHTDNKYKTTINMDIENNSKETIDFKFKGTAGLRSLNKPLTGNKKGKILSINKGSIEDSINWLLLPFDYWANYILLPLQKVILLNIDNQNLVFFESKNVSIPSGSSKRISYSVLSVPIETELLKSYESEGIDKLNRGINYGLFGNLKIYLSSFLERLFSLTGSQFFALFCFMIILKLVTLYLDYLGFVATKKIGKITELAKFSQNAQLFQQEMLKDIKLIIFGISYKYIFKSFLFIIIYQFLSDSILFYKAPFLWIKDLSMPDQVSTSNFFGLLNKNLWFIPKINLLSMLIVFFFLDFRFKLRTFTVEIRSKEQSNGQNIPMIFIVLMLFLFSNFPSIISLYTVLNNSFDKLQNYFFEKIDEA